MAELEKRIPNGGRQVERAARQVSSIADAGKDRIADQLEHVAHALRNTGDTLRQDSEGEQGEQLARYADYVSRSIENASRYLKEHETMDLAHQIERTARTQPLVFLGASFMVGLALGRFLRSGSSSSAGEDWNERRSLHGGESGEDAYEPGPGSSMGSSFGSSSSGGMSGSSGSAFGAPPGGAQPLGSPPRAPSPASGAPPTSPPGPGARGPMGSQSGSTLSGTGAPPSSSGSSSPSGTTSPLGTPESRNRKDPMDPQSGGNPSRG